MRHLNLPLGKHASKQQITGNDILLNSSYYKQYKELPNTYDA